MCPPVCDTYASLPCVLQAWHDERLANDGDRVQGVRYSLLNYQGLRGLAEVGVWVSPSGEQFRPLATLDRANFSRRWNPSIDVPLIFSTADNSKPWDVRHPPSVPPPSPSAPPAFEISGGT